MHRLLYFIGVFFVFILTNTKTWAHPTNCLLFGSEPSLIVKFKHYPSSTAANKLLPNALLKSMNVNGIFFTRSQPVIKDYYLAYFKRKTSSQPILKEKSTLCYTSQSVQQLIKEIKKNPEIDDASPNLRIFATNIKAKQVIIPEIGEKQWSLLAPPGGIDLANAWLNAKNIGDAKVVAAVLDTGIFPNQDLHPLVLHDPANPGSNPNNLSGLYFRTEYQGNQEIHTYGYGAAPTCPAGTTCSGTDPTHGSHVAGIVSATGVFAYNEYIYGVAPSVTLLPINVFTRGNTSVECNPLTPPCYSVQVMDYINAFQWLSDGANAAQFPNIPTPPNNLVVANMSAGGLGTCNPNSLMQSTFNSVYNSGITTVISAGNENANVGDYAPANCDKVIAVAATGPSGERAHYSNWGPKITVAAPGGNDENPYYSLALSLIYSTTNEQFEYLQGTSMAAPAVASLIALLYSVEPTLTPARIYRLLTSPQALTAFPDQTTVPPGTQSCIDPAHPVETCGTGIINANKMMAIVRGTV
ncbi:MAG: S8 family serine peptidase [Legionella sp.]|nr:S8 family serine peptidase [Legionella sp.]